MHINKIEISKSRTAGIQQNFRSKYNKVTLTMSAELNETDDWHSCYQNLNSQVDESLDNQFKPKQIN